MPDPSPPPEHDILRAALMAAGEEGLRRFQRAVVELKPDGTRVTDADKAAEAVLVEALGRAFPGELLIGEEGAREGAGPTMWAIDPIDGTHGFIEGLAYWGPTVGRARDIDGGREVLCGATWLPRLNEFWFAARGEGAWKNGRLLPKLSNDPITRSSVFYVSSRFHRWHTLDFPGKARNLGGTAAHLALVASGSACAAYVPAGWNLWDVIAGFALLRETGGVVKTLTGEPLDLLADAGLPLLAGAPAAVDALLGQLRFRSDLVLGDSDG